MCVCLDASWSWLVGWLVCCAQSTTLMPCRRGCGCTQCAARVCSCPTLSSLLLALSARVKKTKQTQALVATQACVQCTLAGVGLERRRRHLAVEGRGAPLQRSDRCRGACTGARACRCSASRRSCALWCDQCTVRADRNARSG